MLWLVCVNGVIPPIYYHSNDWVGAKMETKWMANIQLSGREKQRRHPTIGRPMSESWCKMGEFLSHQWTQAHFNLVFIRGNSPLSLITTKFHVCSLHYYSIMWPPHWTKSYWLITCTLLLNLFLFPDACSWSQRCTREWGSWSLG